MKKIILILLMILITLTVLAFYADYSTGYRAGIIMKMSRKGMIIKTYEGQLNTGGFSGDVAGGDMTSMIWDFSVRSSNQTVIKEIENAVNQGKRVKIYYKEKYFKVPFWGDTKYFVDSVRLINP